ncbi:MAG: hypothetical protein VX185_03840 [Pseudomonadota bacterium]|nr:hypothetical protein [Pseudomonadota bacterium]
MLKNYTQNTQANTSELEDQIFRNINHPEAGYLPTSFLLKFANPYPENQTLNHAAETVPLDKLWQELNVMGMQQPFVLRVCLSKKTVRLETGNQRIRLFEQHGITKVPVIIEVAETPIADRKNGDQLRPLESKDFDIEKLVQCEDQWCNPLEVVAPHHIERITSQTRVQLRSRAMRHHILMQTQ